MTIKTEFLPIKRYWRRDARLVEMQDELVLETPLEIFIQDMPYSSTMRLPGDDLYLVQGFLFTEGLISSLQDIRSMQHCQQRAGENRVLVELEQTSAWLQSLQDKDMQAHSTFSSCGLCGRIDLHTWLARQEQVPDSGWRVAAAELLHLQEALESRMEIFNRSGGTHAVLLYGPKLEELAFAEDVGRHNALDKAAGQVLACNMREQCALGLVSSRLSLEMVLKAARLGLQVLAGLSAATTLAVHTAHSLNMTLIGFLRPERMNIYCHGRRLY